MSALPKFVKAFVADRTIFVKTLELIGTYSREYFVGINLFGLS
jgi:hypothetical protein